MLYSPIPNVLTEPRLQRGTIAVGPAQRVYWLASLPATAAAESTDPIVPTTAGGSRARRPAGTPARATIARRPDGI
jgi:hypothetical protein